MGMDGRTDNLVKRGTFFYAGSVPYRVEISQTDFRAGTGDYEDLPEFRDDASGTFFDICYFAQDSEQCLSGVRGLESIAAAIAAVEKAGQVVWET
jgi:hypothetical protein